MKLTVHTSLSAQTGRRHIADARDAEPEMDVRPDDPWMLMYTSGTTGKPIIHDREGFDLIDSRLKRFDLWDSIPD